MEMREKTENVMRDGSYQGKITDSENEGERKED